MDISPSYPEALAYLERFYNFEMTPRPARFGLANIERLLDAIGSPESRWSAVHIAGTKGKGSTAAMTEAILRAHGFRTALYTSPHLARIEERCSVDGEPISTEDFVWELEVVKPHVDAMVAQGYTPSFFDVLTAVAFQHFARRRVNAAVVEVGIGGRLDSTNTVHAAVSLVTTLGLDHTDWLGDTIEAIAAEKAGIVRSGVPVVSHPQEEEAWTVVEETCHERGAPLELVGREIRIEEESPGRARSRFCVATPAARYDGLALRMLGAHQRLNAAAAVRAAELFALHAGGGLEETTVREALARAFIPGRIEIVREHPSVVVDGAHNALSIRTLFATLRDVFPRERLFLVFGCAADKDAEAIFRECAGRVDRWVLTRNPTPRAADPEALANLLRWVAGTPATAIEVDPDPIRALSTALAEARPEDVVCCTGSFVLAGALRELLVR